VTLHFPAPRILDFDIENRPLSYLGSDFTTSEITAIAWGFADRSDESVASVLLGEYTVFEMLSIFVATYEAADIVTGHYILGHDLPIINGALLENGMKPLGPKLVSDTKVHLVGGKGVSKSQESLADLLGVEAEKYHMTQAKWRSANRLTPEGLAETRTRVEGDVIQHKRMRAELVRGGYLRRPVLWHGGSRV
jgi:hypothetical protein